MYFDAPMMTGNVGQMTLPSATFHHGPALRTPSAIASATPSQIMTSIACLLSLLGFAKAMEHRSKVAQTIDRRDHRTNVGLRVIGTCKRGLLEGFEQHSLRTERRMCRVLALGNLFAQGLHDRFVGHGALNPHSRFARFALSAGIHADDQSLMPQMASYTAFTPVGPMALCIATYE